LPKAPICVSTCGAFEIARRALKDVGAALAQAHDNVGGWREGPRSRTKR